MPFMTASGQIRPSRRIIVDGRSFSGAGKTAAIRSSRAAYAHALFRGAPLGRCAALPGSPARFACLLLPARDGPLYSTARMDGVASVGSPRLGMVAKDFMSFRGSNCWWPRPPETTIGAIKVRRSIAC
jgi:hypothetical protein